MPSGGGAGEDRGTHGPAPADPAAAGHGWAAGAPSPHTMTQAGADLLGVMDALGLETAQVVGLSYGGGIAQTAAVAAPERFASLTLAATTDFPFDAFENRARSGETDGMPAQVAPSLTRWFTPEFAAENPGRSAMRASRSCVATRSTGPPPGAPSAVSRYRTGCRTSLLQCSSSPASVTPRPRPRS
ncbi:alpha/beta fold hydrolase [Nocardia sp. NPDC051981]|uniref:alpha/beta fold hydrolase n=1 Tax=Nocardia sp. NPDC051981 TaxID=3155417 RepID=UPI003430097D